MEKMPVRRIDTSSKKADFFQNFRTRSVSDVLSGTIAALSD
jgi:hypothetical protein